MSVIFWLVRFYYIVDKIFCVIDKMIVVLIVFYFIIVVELCYMNELFFCGRVEMGGPVHLS